MDELPIGPQARPYAVAHFAPHKVLVCTDCRHKGGVCKPKYALLTRLRAALSAATPADDFEISGTSRLADCAPDHGGPCIAGWWATRTATWFFGDIDPDQPLDDLIAVARTAADRTAGRMTGQDLGPGRSDPTLARLPAAMIVTREGRVQ
jgi:predicted metal-binding protein